MMCVSVMDKAKKTDMKIRIDIFSIIGFSRFAIYIFDWWLVVFIIVMMVMLEKKTTSITKNVSRVRVIDIIAIKGNGVDNFI